MTDTSSEETVFEVGNDRGIHVGRDAAGNFFVTGDGNNVRVVIYQSVAERRDPEPVVVETIGPNPYMGLSAFHEQDAERFFGREKQTERLWNNLRELADHSTAGERLRLLPILGPSGSGKSSLARAGLIPELARRPLPGWKDARVAVLTPGVRPLEELARLLTRIATGDAVPVEKTEEFERVLKRENDAGHHDGLRRIADALPESVSKPLLVFVDQFEEVYSPSNEEMERIAFIENLLHAAGDRSGRVSVVLTLCTDFLDKTQTHEPLHGAICEQPVIVPAMNEEELRQAISKPAVLAGRPLDSAIVELLIKDTRDHDGTLPLMQFALTKMWDGFAQGKAAAETYQAIGGVGGALASEAQRIYEQLDIDEQRIAKRVFLGLVQLGEGTRDTRRRAFLNELVAVGEDFGQVEQLVRRFADRQARLITSSSTPKTSLEQSTMTVEVTHEALFDKWDLLRAWINDNRESLRFKRRLDQAVHEWKENDRDESYLFVGKRLTDAEEWVADNTGGLSQAEREFLDVSRAMQHLRELPEAEQPKVVLNQLSEVGSYAFPAIARLLANANFDSPLRRVERGTAIAEWLLEHDAFWTMAGLLRHTRWPDLRTELIHALPEMGATPEMLNDQLNCDHEVSVRVALILGLAAFSDEQFGQSLKQAVVHQLLQLYEHDPDPGIHGAVEFCLHRFGQADEMQAIRSGLAHGRVEANRRWYVNGQEQCMVLIDSADELSHLRQGDRLAVASTIVSVEQFLRFQFDHEYRHTNSPEPACPINGVSWYDAAAYCNWLSRQEGVPENEWCYLSEGGEGAAIGMTIVPDFHQREGYRLPTEQEWEYACRAGSASAYCFGDSETMLPNYACYLGNSDGRMSCAGRLKPNDFGLFDVHGNAWEWCQDVYRPTRSISIHPEEMTVPESVGRVLRGGSLFDHEYHVRSVHRLSFLPGPRVNNIGFRVARTYPRYQHYED